jgi:alpha-galactosidase
LDCGRWNTYNGYNCNPSESIVKTNAQALIDKGADKLGYTYVTPDCGWMSPNRDSSQRLVWDPTKFPSGGKVLGDWLHNKGLKFGLYSGAGTLHLSSELGLGVFTNKSIDVRLLPMRQHKPKPSSVSRFMHPYDVPVIYGLLGTDTRV